MKRLRALIVAITVVVSVSMGQVTQDYWRDSSGVGVPVPAGKRVKATSLGVTDSARVAGVADSVRNKTIEWRDSSGVIVPVPAGKAVKVATFTVTEATIDSASISGIIKQGGATSDGSSTRYLKGLNSRLFLEKLFSPSGILRSTTDTSGNVEAFSNTNAAVSIKNGLFAANLVVGASNSSGFSLQKNTVRHAGIKWDGTNLIFVDASSNSRDSDQWTGVPIFTINYANNTVNIGGLNGDTAWVEKRRTAADTSSAQITGGMFPISGLEFNLVANGVYEVQGMVVEGNTAATTTGFVLGFTGPASSNGIITASIPIGADGTGGDWQGHLNGAADSTIATDQPATSTYFTARFYGYIYNGANAGAFRMTWRPEAAASLTVRQDSQMSHRRVR